MALVGRSPFCWVGGCLDEEESHRSQMGFGFNTRPRVSPLIYKIKNKKFGNLSKPVRLYNYSNVRDTNQPTYATYARDLCSSGFSCAVKLMLGYETPDDSSALKTKPCCIVVVKEYRRAGEKKTVKCNVFNDIKEPPTRRCSEGAPSVLRLGPILCLITIICQLNLK